MQSRLLLAVTAASLMSFAVGSAGAQTQLTPPESGAPDQPSGVEGWGVSHQELRTFAVAARDVNQIDADYQPKVEAATTPQERQQIAEEATGKMIEAVEEKGLSVDHYNQIAILAEFDPSLAQQIVTYLREVE